MSEHNPMMVDGRLVACTCGVRYTGDNPDDESAQHMAELHAAPSLSLSDMLESLGLLAGAAVSQSMRELREERRQSRYAHCPGCGDTGDVDHIVACVKARMVRRDSVFSPYEAAIAVVEAACKQLSRRGEVHVTSLVNMVTARWGAR